MNRITPHLWFDNQAVEAVDFYVSLFPESMVTQSTTLRDTPSGDCDVVSFELGGQPFMAISAGPLFEFNPSISLLVNFDPSRDPDAQTTLDRCWEALAEGGSALMPLQEYPFSNRYGWIQDRYGLSWQLMLTDPEGEPRPLITPFLMFVGDACGRAEEARDFYLSVFEDSKQGTVARYGADQGPDEEGTIMSSDFEIGNTWMAAMDSAAAHDFGFNEAVSLLIPCADQEEIDYYWKSLSAVPKAEQCGWLKDRYGVSWQVWPTAIGEMMASGTQEQIARLTEAFLPMKKFDLAKLKAAFSGE